MPSDENRLDTLQWLMWQMSTLGPICGKPITFYIIIQENLSILKIGLNKLQKFYKILNNRLKNFNTFQVQIMENIMLILQWPWIARHKRHQINLNDYPGVLRWYKEIYDCPAVQKGYIFPILKKRYLLSNKTLEL